MTDLDPRHRRGLDRMLMLCAFVVPVVGFLITLILWTSRNGVPNGGKALVPGLFLILGVAAIAAIYILVDRHWIRRR